MGEYEEICTGVQYNRSRVYHGTGTQHTGLDSTVERRRQGRKPKEYAAYAVSR